MKLKGDNNGRNLSQLNYFFKSERDSDDSLALNANFWIVKVAQAPNLKLITMRGSGPFAYKYTNEII